MKRRLLGIVLLVLLLVAAAMPLSSCGVEKKVKRSTKTDDIENPLDAGVYDSNGNFIQMDWYPDAKMNDLDDTKFRTENGFVIYTGEGYQSAIAIDVSSNQGIIDWNAVKAAGVEYAIIRLGYRTYGSGIIMTDEFGYYNMKEAAKAGIKLGVYVFSQAISIEEAEEEAQFALDMVKPFELDLPIYYDTEEINYDVARTDKLSGEEHAANAIAFCDYIKKAGYTPGIYGNQMWLCNKMNLYDLEQYSIWLAKYEKELNYPYEIEAWQYSSEGHVDGIGSVVDLDVILTRKKN